jgi:hypothetical protein
MTSGEVCWTVVTTRIQGICNLSSSDELLPSRCSPADERSVPARSDAATHTARRRAVVNSRANSKGAHRAISQRKSGYWRSPKNLHRAH